MVQCCCRDSCRILGAYLGAHRTPESEMTPNVPLTDIKIRSAKPREKAYKLFDSGGLSLRFLMAAASIWRWKYRFGGKEKRLAFGVYPDASLKAARQKRDIGRQQIGSGIDLGQARKVRCPQKRTRAPRVLKRSPESGTQSSHRVGYRVMARITDGQVSSTYSTTE